MKVALIDKQLKVLSYDPAKIHGAGFLVKRNTQEQLKVLSDDPAKIHGAGFLVKRNT
ncbi:MAG: hypothetical protein AB1394_11735 [Bacteroidota bacterium]